MLCSEIDILVESLERVRNELNALQKDYGENERLFKEKDHDMDNLRI